MDKNIPFPQADDFEKIVFILNITNEDDLNDLDKIQVLFGNVAARQVAYYLSASTFIGLITDVNGKKGFTQKAKLIRRMNSYMQTAELIALILSNRVFAKIYSYTQMFGKQEVEEVADTIREEYPNYSRAIYERRAQTVLSWIDWINKKIYEK